MLVLDQNINQVYRHAVINPSTFIRGIRLVKLVKV